MEGNEHQLRNIRSNFSEQQTQLSDLNQESVASTRFITLPLES